MGPWARVHGPIWAHGLISQARFPRLLLIQIGPMLVVPKSTPFAMGASVFNNDIIKNNCIQHDVCITMIWNNFQYIIFNEAAADRVGGYGGRTDQEHPSPIFHAPRDNISRKSKSLSPIYIYIYIIYNIYILYIYIYIHTWTGPLGMRQFVLGNSRHSTNNAFD